MPIISKNQKTIYATEIYRLLNIEMMNNELLYKLNKLVLVVYNKSFEDRCLFEISRDFPEYEKDISNIRMVQLSIKNFLIHSQKKSPQSL